MFKELVISSRQALTLRGSQWINISWEKLVGHRYVPLQKQFCRLSDVSKNLFAFKHHLLVARHSSSLWTFPGPSREQISYFLVLIY